MNKYAEAVRIGGDEWFNHIDPVTCYTEPRQNYREYRIAVDGLLERRYNRQMRDMHRRYMPNLLASPSFWPDILNALRLKRTP